MFNADRYGITIAEMKGFMEAAARALSWTQYEALVDFLAINPMAGDVIPDTSGIRMIRWPTTTGRRRPQVRIIYFFRDLNMPVYLLALYESGERMNFSKAEKAHMRFLVEDIVNVYAADRLRALSNFNGAA